MKKLGLLVIAFVMAVTFAACGTKGAAPVSFEANGVAVTAEVPKTGWYSEQRTNTVYYYNVATKDEVDSGSPRVQVVIENKAESFDRYKDSFENLDDLGTKTIGGIEMTGRAYKYVGMDWNEYFGTLDSTKAVSVKCSKVDMSSDEVMGILNSIKLEKK